MDILFIIGVAVYLYVRWRQERHGNDPDGLGRVRGEATDYDECPVCAERNCQSPRGRGEVITRGGNYVVRQYHVCENCNSRALWHRRLDLWVWTVNRNGVQS